ncbi:tripartite tricarboxylate transporter substrate binding protein [Verticiella sediminum]|uniref:Tripartite tricarboxylate transporter substrate binding protein n=1 Tax=Verticiella sediminum TaxID=1247510 RepID=A0A556AED0_9BURK|nr:tripartite tricarboxylate transporter substrate-binding protein [Verticiella sediminum]TSH91250.1 tripartite tricarboxylate transporter substrate binding protein [Verticiella sediminum]
MIASIYRRAATLLTLAFGFCAAPALAQPPWQPDRPVTLIVPYSVGGGTDALARAVAKDLSDVWQQSVIVENVPGADGMIGTRKVIGARPDGYTLLVQIHAITLARHLPASNGFDPLPQLEPITAYAELAGVFVATPKLPGETLAETFQGCKTNARSCSFGTTESVARLQGQMLRADEGMENLVVVNYKGGGQLITDLVAGTVDMAVMGITAAMPHYKSGALKILATLGDKRTSITPDVPSAAEAGFPGLDAITWYGLFAPKGTPQAIVEGVAAATARAVQGQTTQQTFASLGAQAISPSPADFAARIEAESARMTELVQRFPFTQ